MANGKRIAFLDRDGTLILEPADEQVDRLDKVALVPGVVPALLRLKDAGYEFVMVTNQDGLGTDSFPGGRLPRSPGLCHRTLRVPGHRVPRSLRVPAHAGRRCCAANPDRDTSAISLTAST